MTGAIAPKNVLDGFWQQVTTLKDAPSLAKKVSSKWEVWSWTLVGEKVARMASALQKAGAKPGDRIALFSENTSEWAVTDFACLAGGFVSVPLYPTQTESQVQYILGHAGIKIAVVRGKARLQKLLSLPTIEKIIEIDDGTGVHINNGKVISFEDFIETGSPDITTFVTKAKTINLKDLATIVYTSGTTANPKGVMLTHGNHFAQSNMVGVRSHRTKDDVLMSYLPLSHITERINLYRQAMTGYVIYFTQTIENVAQELKEIRPTSFVAVPRIWEKFQEAIQARLRDAPPARQRLFRRIQDLGNAHFEAMTKTGKAPLGLRIRLALMQRIVGKKLKAALGFDRTHHFISGAAPLSIDTIKFFYALGMPIIEGYGLTECAGASHVNLADNPKYGTVGPHLDGLECKIAEDGEILLRGDNVFVGYYNDPDQTREVLINDWLHTGDIGHYDPRGCLKITDRKKNIIVTSGGKNIAPAPLEAKLKHHQYISQVVVVGDKRKYLSALITLNPGFTSTQARHEIETHIENLNKSLPSYETIKRFAILDKDFSIDGGELTPTMKTKRSFIQEKYKSTIEGMYQTESKGFENQLTL